MKTEKLLPFEFPLWEEPIEDLIEVTIKHDFFPQEEEPLEEAIGS